MLYDTAKQVLAGNPLYEAVRRVHVRRRERRQARERANYEAWLATKPYQEQLAIRACDLFPVPGKKVLVVGANKGEDCRLFADRGAAEVHGLDVIEDVGRNFVHPRARYTRAGIENSGLESGSFDLVFSVATMEHVPDIATGFAEMARLARSGGMVFSLAAPLWQSPYGHHMACFAGHPWVHLVHDTPDALVAYARAHGIAGERGHDIDGIARYMLDPEQFNRRPASEYKSICAGLPGLAIQRNELMSENETLLAHPLGEAALKKGYEAHNLLATAHYFIAGKL